MTNEQLTAYLLCIINSLNVAIFKTMDNLPEDAVVKIGVEGDLFNPMRLTYPVLEPILEFKESLYEQLEGLKGIK